MRKDSDTPLLSFYSRLTALAKLNLLFLLCALPLVTAGASAAALMGALEAWRHQEHWTAGVFFRAFGRSLRRGAVLWVGMPVLGGSLAADYLLLAGMELPGKPAAVGAVFFAFFALVLTAGMLPPLLARSSGPVRETLVSAVLLAFRHLPRMLAVTAANLLPLALYLLLPGVFVLTGWFWLLWGFALLGLCSLHILAPVLPQAETPPGE